MHLDNDRWIICQENTVFTKLIQFTQKERFENDLNKQLNLEFYTNKLKIHKGRNFDEFIVRYSNDFYFLQNRTDYIQWLFPIYSQGKNKATHPLQLHELEVRSNNILKIFRK